MSPVTSRRGLVLLLIVATVPRLVHLKQPILGLQAWRQADTAAFARNYYENGFRFLYPQVDWGGDSDGVIESEFPLYSFAVAVAYAAFGVSETWGRLLSVLCALATIFFLYRLVEATIDRRTAFWTTLVYAALPMNVYYNRAFMPDTAMLAASVASVYFFARWTDNARLRDFLLSALATALAALLKLPALYLGLPLLYLAHRRFGAGGLKEVRVWVFGVLVLAPVALWYYHAHQLFRTSGLTFGIWAYGADKWGNWELVSSFDYWNNILFKRITERNLTWVGFGLMIIGMLFPRRSARERVFDFWILAIVIYFVVVGQGNAAHEYYQLPFFLPACVYVGKLYARYFDFSLRPKATVLLGLCLSGILIASGLRYVYFYLAREDPGISLFFYLAREVREKTPGDARIVSFLGGDPSIFYWSHRKGWNARPAEVTDALLDDLSRRGADYAVGCHRDFDRAGALDRLELVRARGESLLSEGVDCFVIAIGELPSSG